MGPIEQVGPIGLMADRRPRVNAWWPWPGDALRLSVRRRRDTVSGAMGPMEQVGPIGLMA